MTQTQEPSLNDPVIRNDWHVAMRASDLPQGQPTGVTVLGEKLVLWRTGNLVQAWRDLCIHRGAQLSLGRIADGCLVCPYHGWAYAPDGACAHIPSQPDHVIPTKARAFTYHAREHLGWVWVCLGEPQSSPPLFPEFDDSLFRIVHCGPYRWRALGPRAIENFLDVSHLAFVHPGTLGEAGHTRLADYDVRSTPDSVVADDIAVWQPDPDGSGVGAFVHYRYEVMRPLAARLSKGTTGNTFALIFAVTPLDEEYSEGWAIIAMDYETGQTDDEIRAFEDTVMGQDSHIVESQRPELLPLDLQAELNLRSDRMSIAYRQWLRAKGLRYGAA